tara:strand:+ start:427 stop:714 length:288 start_codon:yes stop_codon:yes gene_type:complete
MKWAIVFYAIFGYVDGSGTEQDISYGLTFNHHETCISFFEDNKKKVIDGVKTYAEMNYEYPMQLLEVGCAHATITPNNEPPEVTMEMPLWNGNKV